MKKVEWLSQRCDPQTLRAEQLMEDSVKTCLTQDVALTVAHTLYDGNYGSLPVVDEANTLEGLVTEFDLLKVIEAGQDLRITPVSTIMNPEVLTVTPRTPFQDILQLLQRHHLIRVPVVEGKTLVGILARRDIILGYIKATDVGRGI